MMVHSTTEQVVMMVHSTTEQVVVMVRSTTEQVVMMVHSTTVLVMLTEQCRGHTRPAIVCAEHSFCQIRPKELRALVFHYRTLL